MSTQSQGGTLPPKQIPPQKNFIISYDQKPSQQPSKPDNFVITQTPQPYEAPPPQQPFTINNPETKLSKQNTDTSQFTISNSQTPPPPTQTQQPFIIQEPKQDTNYPQQNISDQFSIINPTDTTPNTKQQDFMTIQNPIAQQTYTPPQTQMSIIDPIVPGTQFTQSQLAAIFQQENSYKNKIAAQTPFSIYSPIQQQTTKNQLVAPTLENLFTNPIGVLDTILGLGSIAADKLPKNNIGSTFINAEVGGAGNMLNQYNSVDNAIKSVIKAPQTSNPFTPLNTAQQAGMVANTIGETVILATVAPEILPISTPAILGGAALNLGLSQGIEYAQSGKVGTPQQMANDALVGSLFAVGGSGVFSGITQVANKGVPIVSKVAGTLIGTTAGRTAVASGIGAGVGYATTGTPEGAIEGAAMGGIFSLGGELTGKTILPKLQQLGGAEQLTEGPKVITFDNQEVPSYVSKPNEGLGGKQLQIISSVTSEPVGSKGITLESMKAEYSGQTVPTSHATLETKGFNLGNGDTTLLKGFPTEASGGRANLELYHFYSAPGDTNFVKGYGGYMGIGEGESGSVPQIKSGKASLLITNKTFVDPTLMKQPNESTGAFLDRFSRASGKTGLGPETQLGISQERQLETPASYLRNGKQLPGSIYRSGGKVGTFQIKQYSESSIFGKPIKEVPVLKDLTAKYTKFDVFKGEYESVLTDESTASLKPTETINRPTKIVSSNTSFLSSSGLISSPRITSTKQSSYTKTSNPISSIYSQNNYSSTNSKNSSPILSASNFNSSPINSPIKTPFSSPKSNSSENNSYQYSPIKSPVSNGYSPIKSIFNSSPINSPISNSSGQNRSIFSDSYSPIKPSISSKNSSPTILRATQSGFKTTSVF